MNSKLRKLFQLEPIDQQLLIEAYLCLGLVRLGLWLLPFGSLRKVLNKINSYQITDKLPVFVQIEQITTAINRSSHYSPGDVKCLAKALATEVLLTKYGYFPLLKIGVAKGERGQLEAHAWVEERGKIVIGNLRDLSRYKPLPSLKQTAN
jgi:hypothetical protein